MILRIGRRIKSLIAGLGGKKKEEIVPEVKKNEKRSSGKHKAPSGDKVSAAHNPPRRRNEKTSQPQRPQPAAKDANLPERVRRRKPKAEKAREYYDDEPVVPSRPREIPPKPEKLIEIPPEEGKARFIDFPIANDVLFGIQALEFRYCTPIQAQCLSHALAGRDVTGKAQTGTGKTAAFLISAFTRMLANPLPPESRKPGSCRVLVMAPTRELAIQIHKDAEKLGMFCGFHNLVVFGGMGHKTQRAELARPVDVLVGTPGRILDYCSSGDLNLRNVEMLVIDEADRMLDMGFIPDVKRIVGQLPKTGVRQTMFFSATFDDSINALIKSWLHDPVTVEIESEHMVTDLIDQRFYAVPVDEKFPLLLWLINHENIERMLIFVNRKDDNASLCDRLKLYGIDCESLSGDVPQQKRIKILERFRDAKVKVLIATDVAARGIHVDGVSHVINYELPERPEDYVHRVGRTGRAGNTGKSISFVDEYGAYALPEIEKLMNMEVKSVYPEENMVHLDPVAGDRGEKRFGMRRPFGGGGRSFGGDRRRSGGDRRGPSRRR